MDGLEKTLLVALTGYGRESDRERAHDAGFDVFLVKPTPPKQLCEIAMQARR
jgi:CheY-like chemotaxis protein